MPTKEEIIQRVKRSLEHKREMEKRLTAMLEQMQAERTATGTVNLANYRD